jgi:ABC-type branched-subunit amino acid transport system ATPase component
MTVLLRTEGVRKAYGGVHALDTCTVEVEEGSVAGLIGPNGSGKTTLFNVITGYAKADAGHVYLADRKITNLSPDKVFALGIGRTFQLTRIFASLTVLENMLVASPNGRASAGTTPNWPARSPTASASSSSSPTCWWRTLPSSCSTSRPAASTYRWSTTSPTGSAS